MSVDDKINDKKAQSEYIRRFIHTKLDCGKNVLELTAYNDVSMWWCVDTLFYNFVSSFTSGGKSKKTFFHKWFIVFYIWIGFYLEAIYDITMMMLVRLIEYLYRRDGDDVHNLLKMIFIAQDIQWKIVRDYETGQPKRTDAFFDSVLKNLHGWSLIGVYPITNHPMRGLRVYIEKMKKWSVTHIVLNRFWSVDAFKEQHLALNYFRKQFGRIKKDMMFKKLCFVNGNDMHDNIISELKFYFMILFPYQIKLMTMTRDIIKYVKPDLIVLLNEYGWVERPMLIAARFEKVPVLAIQHGVITLVCKGYMYNKNEIHPKMSAQSPYCPIPDKTAVYGKFHYDLLTQNSAYPKNSVVITGQPRYDILYRAKEIYSKEQFFKKHGINKKNKIVLWTTQCHGLSNSENIKNFEVVLRTMKDMNKTTLVIKQHPGEDKRYNKIISRYLKQYKIEAVVTPKESDVIELIYACDLMITKHSTTAIEAVALNKPVIILDMEDKNDLGGYVAQGVALGVFCKNELKPTIQKLLKDDSELSIKRKNYIERYMYKIDGKSTDRVVEIIEKMIDTKQESII